MTGNFHECQSSSRPFFFNCKPRANFPRGRLNPFHLDASLLLDAKGRLREPFKSAERAHDTFRLSMSPRLYFHTSPRKVVCLTHASRTETDKPHAQRPLSKNMLIFVQPQQAFLPNQLRSTTVHTTDTAHLVHIADNARVYKHRPSISYRPVVPHIRVHMLLPITQNKDRSQL